MPRQLCYHKLFQSVMHSHPIHFASSSHWRLQCTIYTDLHTIHPEPLSLQAAWSLSSGLHGRHGLLHLLCLIQNNAAQLPAPQHLLKPLRDEVLGSLLQLLPTLQANTVIIKDIILAKFPSGCILLVNLQGTFPPSLGHN